MDKVIKAVIPEKYLDERTVYHINPCGQFVLGGPQVGILALFVCEYFLLILKGSSTLIFIFKV